MLAFESRAPPLERQPGRPQSAAGCPRDWVGAAATGLAYFQGVPRIILYDNTAIVVRQIAGDSERKRPMPGN